MAEINQFDINAAWMRRGQSDFRAFMEGFATRMEGAFPDHVRVDRRRDGLLSATRHVHQVSVELGQHTYTLAFNGGRLAANRTQIIRGIKLKSEDMQVPDWLGALNSDLSTLAGHAESAQTVLHDFLLS